MDAQRRHFRKVVAAASAVALRASFIRASWHHLDETVDRIEADFNGRSEEGVDTGRRDDGHDDNTGRAVPTSFSPASTTRSS